jgi:hypothetical protein
MTNSTDCPQKDLYRRINRSMSETWNKGKEERDSTSKRDGHVDQEPCISCATVLDIDKVSSQGG